MRTTSFPTSSAMWMPPCQRRLTSSSSGPAAIKCPPTGASSLAEARVEALPVPPLARRPCPDIRGSTLSDSRPSQPLKHQPLFTAMDPIHVHAVSMTATLAFSTYIDIAQVDGGRRLTEPQYGRIPCMTESGTSALTLTFMYSCPQSGHISCLEWPFPPLVPRGPCCHRPFGRLHHGRRVERGSDGLKAPPRGAAGYNACDGIYDCGGCRIGGVLGPALPPIGDRRGQPAQRGRGRLRPLRRIPRRPTLLDGEGQAPAGGGPVSNAEPCILLSICTFIWNTASVRGTSLGSFTRHL
jgi:hypothetical protein